MQTLDIFHEVQDALIELPFMDSKHSAELPVFGIRHYRAEIFSIPGYFQFLVFSL